MEPASSGALVVSGGGLEAMGRALSIVVRGAAAAACLSISRGQVRLLAGRLAGELAPGGGSQAGEPRREALATEEPRRRPVKRDDMRRGMGVGVANQRVGCRREAR